MFNDTIVLNNSVPAAVTFTKRSPRGSRNVWVPSGDLPSSERRIEIGHEVTSAKRVNSLVKIAKVTTHPVTNVLEEHSYQVKIVHPASATLADVKDLNAFVCSFFGTAANVEKVFNQE